MNIIIKQMSLYDLEKMKDNLTTDFDSFWSYDLFYEELQNPRSTYLVAKYKEEIVGFGGIWRAVDEAHITNLVTKKENRQLGIASQILEKLILLAKQESFNCITLEVRENNKAAIALYEKYNFKRIGFRKKYYNNKENAILMTRFFG